MPANYNLKNLLEETKNAIKASGHMARDVKWVGSRDGLLAASWSVFQKVAQQYEYPQDSSGRQYVWKELIIVFKDNNWLQRSYDGVTESWTYMTPPKKIQEHGRLHLEPKMPSYGAEDMHPDCDGVLTLHPESDSWWWDKQYELEEAKAS